MSSGGPWEERIGYARAVRAGAWISVSGCTAAREGTPRAPPDPYVQSRLAYATLIQALRELGAGPEDVVRVRLFVTDIGRWEEVVRAHRENFGGARPAMTMVEVARLIRPDLTIEVEADAVLPPPPLESARRAERT